ncbi:glycine--tRNA ligase subunit beta [Bacillaceae bacterium S4-13-58]
METRDFILEIGLEEMPARYIDDALHQLQSKIENWLNEKNLSFSHSEVFSTPRRLAVSIHALAEEQEDQEEEARGPSKKIAQDGEGNWTKAAIGFARGQGGQVEDLTIKEHNGTEYVFLTKFIKGKRTIELLPELKDIIENLSFPKNMKWGTKKLRYIRPIRWIVSLFGEELVTIQAGGVKSGRQTYGHRFLGEDVSLSNATEYVAALESQFVIVDSSKRKGMILEGIAKLEKDQGWKIPVDQELLQEVLHLVEYPTVFYGSFLPEYLELPEEVLITSMKEHQRYFPVKDQENKLLPYFVAVRNGNEQYIEVVSKGNEKVLKARLADARFFFEEDQKASIEGNLEKLDRMVFHEELGSIGEKVKRVSNLTEKLAQVLGASQKETQNAIRIASISKFDLVTHMVDEFPELQGVMGEKYAKLFGENEIVAKGIREHYYPRFSGDVIPETLEGSIVSITDKLDTIVGCFGIGIIPSGSQDPYALRRQGAGILQILLRKKWKIHVEELLKISLDRLEESKLLKRSRQEIEKDLHEFFQLRCEFLLKEHQVDYDVTNAVTYKEIGNIAFLVDKGTLLSSKRIEEEFKLSQEAFGRVLNLASKAESNLVEPELFENETEKELYDILQKVTPVYREHMESHRASDALKELEQLTKPIHSFFDKTMVMVEDESVKKNRLALLNQIAQLIFAFGDLNEIQWKQKQMG